MKKLKEYLIMFDDKEFDDFDLREEKTIKIDEDFQKQDK